MKTLAELVESEEIMIKLRTMGIDYAEGFHLDLPHANFR
jgi:EAL domain-containing protein (putative c-di-GMP-specific phosphodiesterase class I)